jgi:ribosomal RNA-processing protein 36
MYTEEIEAPLKSKIENLNVKAKRKSKHAPVEESSSRPAKRRRQVVEAVSKRIIDPRFDSSAGTLDNDRFLKSYSFLEEYQASEISKAHKRLKKARPGAYKQDLEKEINVSKQNVLERRRYRKVKEKLTQRNVDEKEKVRKGKVPYFMKASEKKKVVLEERYNELKTERKLTKFMKKKRSKKANHPEM